MTGPNDVVPLTSEGSHSQSTLDSSSVTRPLDDATNNLVQSCLNIIERRRKGEIRTSEATRLLLGVLPSSEDGERALEQYVEMCVEMDRDNTLANDRGKEIADRLGPDARNGGGIDPPSQPREADRPDIHLRLPRQFEDISNDLKTDDAKKSFDRTKLPWYSRPEPALDPIVQETLDKKHFYLANYKEVKRDLLGQADCPAFPDSLWHDVIVGNYIDLDKVYTGRYSLEADTEFTQTVGDIDFRIRGNGSVGKTVKEVRSHSEWTVAFHSAKSAILYLYPNRREELATYENFIIGQFAATKPDEHRRVIALDKAIRKEAARVNNCTLTTVPSFNAFGTQYLNTIGLGASSHSSSTLRTIAQDRVDSAISACSVKAGSKRKTALATSDNIEARWKKPRYTRGFLWSADEEPSTPSAASTIFAAPLPSPPPSELSNQIALETIRKNPHLFKIVTPINVPRFETLLQSHPNRPYVESVCRGLSGDASRFPPGTFLSGTIPRVKHPLEAIPRRIHPQHIRRLLWPESGRFGWRQWSSGGGYMRM
ncbi:hypothetical protein M422DRAFT_270448 [Sphaerobolus stellatus SS14]|uniref:Uncharacterized protein n=1 Tax=Sphaerobolus stellatus (strain SS14) TaxID=990650 RepID=A0A0C9USU6_SPHS4|nr:hypothetical protein M422DRAFT_270448 [Sphaerobolus stellatus SS14]